MLIVSILGILFVVISMVLSIWGKYQMKKKAMQYSAEAKEFYERLKQLADPDHFFTDEELQHARKHCAGGLRALEDSPGALEEFWLSQTLKGLDYGPAELAALCEMVTREDIVSLAGGIELDSVYFLHGADDADGEEGEDDAAD